MALDPAALAGSGRKRPGRKPREFNEQQRMAVEFLVGCGMTQPEIAMVLDMGDRTLRRRFRRELDTGETLFKAKLFGALGKAIDAGNMAAVFFTLKCRFGWSEKVDPVEHTHRWANRTDEELTLELDAIQRRLRLGDQLREADQENTEADGAPGLVH